MIRRLFHGFSNETNSKVETESEGVTSPPVISPSASTASAPAMLETEEVRKEADPAVFKTDELSPFDGCIEACDELASTSTSSGRADPVTGLVDCSVLVSADGHLLIIPQEQAHGPSSIVGADPEAPKHARMQKILQFAANELGSEYASAVFLGNDLDSLGDKALNGFAAKGWSIPATSLALRQSSDVMGDFSDFCEDLVLAKKSIAASENQMINLLRPLVEGPERGGLRVLEYNQYLKDTYPEQQIEILPTRVGPLSSPGGTVQATLVALEQYYSSTAESDSRRWKRLADQNGPMSTLRQVKSQTDQRATNREAVLRRMVERTNSMEGVLSTCKKDAAKKWDEVHTAEENVSKLVEDKMAERSRLREQQRLEQLKQEVEKAQDAKHAQLGATSSEIWDIVSAVAASMEEGSFEPMDLPQAPLSAPRDKSRLESEQAEAGVEDDPNQPGASPVASRHELEEECGLPELRAAAMAADEAVADAANNLLNSLATWDTASRSARLAAETCLVDAANAQASCIRAIVKAERESLKERLKQLDELEKTADDIDVRVDMHHYITLDKKEPGGRSLMGDDDDGGIASALAVLNNHIDGDLGMVRSSSNAQNASSGEEGTHEFSPENIEQAVDEFFQDKPLLRSDDAGNAKAEEAKERLEITVLRLCKLGKDKSSSARSLRSTLCYSLKSKQSIHSKINSRLQFDGLCRVFSAVLTGCATDSSGAALAKMLMTLSQTFFVESENGEEHVKNKLCGHAYWEKEEFWDQALYQTVAESLTHSGVMSNFDRPGRRIVTEAAKKKSEWTETYKMKWHDLSDNERSEAASQVHAVVFAQIGALAHSMIDFGCSLERSVAFVRRMSVRNQLPMSQRTMLLEHLVGYKNHTVAAPVKLSTPSR